MKIRTISLLANMSHAEVLSIDKLKINIFMFFTDVR
jgi:hypothetical protein